MHTVPILAGVLATALFTASALPMLAKARRTRDLGSYSIGNIGLANVGNLVQTIYVLSLPPGPIWALHAFQLSTSALMLAWYLRFRASARTDPPTRLTVSSKPPSQYSGTESDDPTLVGDRTVRDAARA